MSKIEYIDKILFSEKFSLALNGINISESSISKFIENNSKIKLSDLGICISLTNIIDTKMKEFIIGYDGCLPYETFDIIYEWNKEMIYEFEKTRAKE